MKRSREASAGESRSGFMISKTTGESRHYSTVKTPIKEALDTALENLAKATARTRKRTNELLDDVQKELGRANKRIYDGFESTVEEKMNDVETSVNTLREFMRSLISDEVETPDENMNEKGAKEDEKEDTNPSDQNIEDDDDETDDEVENVVTYGGFPVVDWSRVEENYDDLAYDEEPEFNDVQELVFRLSTEVTNITTSTLSSPVAKSASVPSQKSKSRPGIERALDLKLSSTQSDNLSLEFVPADDQDPSSMNVLVDHTL